MDQLSQSPNNLPVATNPQDISLALQSLFSKKKAEGVQTIPSLCAVLSENAQNERAIVGQGVGLQRGEIPLRFLSYVVPTLKLLGVLPTSVSAEIYFATHGVARANAPEALPEYLRQSELMRKLIRCYVDEVHKDVAGRVRILEDREIDESDPTAQLISDLCKRHGDALRSDTAIRNFLEKRGEESALRYLVEHALYMRDPLQPKPIVHGLVPGMSCTPDRVVMIGGESERIFFKARQIILASVDQSSREWKSHHVFCVIGDKRPTYHMETGEPPWSDLKSFSTAAEIIELVSKNVTVDFGRRSSVMLDLLVLFADAGNLSIVFGDKLVDQAINGRIDPTMMAAFDRGLDRLKLIIDAWRG